MFKLTFQWQRRSLDTGPDLQQRVAIGTSDEDHGAGSQGGGAIWQRHQRCTCVESISIYTYMYIYIYTHIYTHTYIYIYVYIHIYICIYLIRYSVLCTSYMAYSYLILFHLQGNVIWCKNAAGIGHGSGTSRRQHRATQCQASGGQKRLVMSRLGMRSCQYNWLWLIYG